MTNASFIDLFAGIGGTRIAFERVGTECVFSSEIDKFARQTYVANFNEEPFGDITGIHPDSIPDHEILVAGFPCQPFSLAGVPVSKFLDKKSGFEHPTQGTMFFEIEKILRAKHPKAFLLENVKNLKSHDKGRTFQIILDTLQDPNGLNYKVEWAILDASKVVPQHRERTYIVGFADHDIEFNFPELQPRSPELTLKDDILETTVNPKYQISEHIWKYFRERKIIQQAKGNGFSYGIVDPDQPGVITRTLTARYYKDGAEIFVKNEHPTPRRLTPRECARLMTFPDDYIIPVSDTQAYKQFGNSVVIDVVEQIARSMIDQILPEFK